MTDKPELSRIINVAEIFSSSKPVDISIKANPDELAALAKRFGLVDISSLEAEVRLSAIGGATDRGDDVLAEAGLRATLTQTCSVTMDHINDKIEANFSQTFSSAPESLVDSGGESLENEGFSENSELFDLEASTKDAPEAIIGGAIDLGEFISQELFLRINPFPRKKDVEFEWVNKNNGQAGNADNPFAKLSALKDSLNGEKEPKKSDK